MLTHRGKNGAPRPRGPAAKRIRRLKHHTGPSRSGALALLHDLPVMIWRSGIDGKCDYFNKAWLEFTGRRLDQELGDGWAEGVHPDDRKRCVRDYLDAFKARKPLVLEYRLRDRNGEHRWIRDVGRPVSGADGQFAGDIGGCLDLTEHNRMHEQLVAQAALLDAANDAIIVREADSDRITYWNQGAARLYGWSREEALGRTMHELLATVFPEPLKYIKRKLLAENHWAGKLHHGTRDGGAVVVESQWTLERGRQDRPDVVLVINHDITKRERALEAALHFEERFFRIFRFSPIAINIGSLPEGRIIDANDRYLEFFGYTRDDVIGRTVAELGIWADPEERERFMQQIEATGSVRNAEGRFRRKSGQIAHALFSVEKMELQGRVVAVTMRVDITDRKRSEGLVLLQSAAAVALSQAPDFRSGLEQVIRLICEHTGWAVGEAWLPNADDTRLVWSGAFHSSIAGIEHFVAHSRQRTFRRGERFTGKAWASGQPAWRTDAAGVYRRASLIPGGVGAHCVVPVVAESAVVAILSFFSPSQRPHEQRLLDAIAGIAAQLAVLLKRKRVEESLRQSEERLALFARHMQGAFFIKDAQGRYLFANPMAEAAQGVAPGGWKGKTDDELFPAGTASQLRANDRAVLDTRQAIQTIETTGEPNVRHWLVHKFPIPGGPDSPSLLGGTAFDITELKRTEDALRRALDEKDRLYADLHDNTVQVLFGVGMALEECTRLIVEDPGQAAAGIRQSVDELNQVISDIRKYISGKRPDMLTAQQVRAELAWLAKMTGAGAKPRFRLDVDDAAVSRLASDDARDLMAVAREALSNALRHSGGDHGTLALGLSRGAVVLEVADDGKSFASAARRSASGGLLNMEVRARRMGARLRITSAPGRGTRIVLRIPLRKTPHADE